LFQTDLVSLVLDGVVEQGGHGHLFVASGVEHQRRYSDQVRNVWRICALATLVAVQLMGETERIIEASGEGLSFAAHGSALLGGSFGAGNRAMGHCNALLSIDFFRKR